MNVAPWGGGLAPLKSASVNGCVEIFNKYFCLQTLRLWAEPEASLAFLFSNVHQYILKFEKKKCYRNYKYMGQIVRVVFP